MPGETPPPSGGGQYAGLPPDQQSGVFGASTQRSPTQAGGMGKAMAGLPTSNPTRSGLIRHLSQAFPNPAIKRLVEMTAAMSGTGQAGSNWSRPAPSSTPPAPQMTQDQLLDQSRAQARENARATAPQQGGNEMDSLRARAIEAGVPNQMLDIAVNIMQNNPQIDSGSLVREAGAEYSNRQRDQESRRDLGA